MDSLGTYTPPQKSNTPKDYIDGDFVSELTSDDIEVTAPAQAKLNEIISSSEEDISGIRIYIGGGGCGGMTYGMTFTDAATEFDTTLTFESFKIYVDVVALHYLRGAQIDYIEEVGRERFVFNNVFASTGGSGSCGGCGSSGGGH
ncbi:MAG: iron-sulfur cluster assembly accessory protein [Gammaproteobacteria bacterium]|nr:iron-sulfur cluster assembly accessory protein [Gammaproteobacteria bacterium]